MAPRIGEGRIIPVLDMERERRAAAPGEVKTYKLPPEEIERIFGGKKPNQPSMPGFTYNPAEAKRKAEQYAKSNEEAEAMKDKLTKEGYLQERVAGANRTAICRKYFGKDVTGFYKRLQQWGIKDQDAEEIAIVDYRQRTTDPTPLPADTSDLVHRGPTPELQPIGAHVGEPPESVPLALDGVEWFVPAVPEVSGPKVSVNRLGIAFEQDAAKMIGLIPGGMLQIGVNGNHIYFRTEAGGLRVKPSGKTSLRVQSRQLGAWPRWERIVKRKYELREDDGVFYVEVEVNVQ